MGVCVRWKATVNCVVIEVLYNNTRIDAVKSISFNECTDKNLGELQPQYSFS